MDKPKQLKFTSKNQADIQAYIDYVNIVGADDKGKLMSEQEFEAYKKNVSEKRKNRLYVYWVNSTGFECKTVGPETMCFCNHRYKYHDFDSVKDKKVKCKKCTCKLFEHVPCYGANDVKCLCHHSYREHDLKTRKCKRNNCKCNGFGSKFTCNCGEGYNTHKTMIYTKEERINMGKPVDAGWFGESLMNGAGGMQNFGSMMNDVYETEFKNMEKKPEGKKIMYKGGIPVQNQQKGFNNYGGNSMPGQNKGFNNNLNKINNYGYNNIDDDDPYAFDKMSYEQAFGIKKNK